MERAPAAQRDTVVRAGRPVNAVPFRSVLAMSLQNQSLAIRGNDCSDISTAVTNRLHLSH